jgi:nitrogen regulatory protein PII 1
MMMKLIRAIVRPDIEGRIIDELDKIDLGAMTKVNVYGQGKQKSRAESPIEWDDSLTKYSESPKVMLMLAVDDADVQTVTDVIMNVARTGNVGDGKIFISSIDKSYTVSRKTADCKV